MSPIGPSLPPHLVKRQRSPENQNTDLPPTKTPRTANECDIIPDDVTDSDPYAGFAPRTASPRHAAATSTPARPPTRPSLHPGAGAAAAAAAAAKANHPDGIGLDTSSSSSSSSPSPSPLCSLGPVTSETGPGPGPRPASASASTAQLQAPAGLSPAHFAPHPCAVVEPSADPPDSDPDSDSDSDSDSYGPAPASCTSTSTLGEPAQPARTCRLAVPAAPVRDDWMLAPPSATGYQERDPTKIRARKFATGGGGARSAPHDGGAVSRIWTETAEEKAKRLADEVLGRAGHSGPRQSPSTAAKTSMGLVGGGGTAQQHMVNVFPEQTTARSLYEEHQASRKVHCGKGGHEDDDDPSKRAFDREKDMGLGARVTASQRKELISRASNFGGRFQKGNYL